MTLRQHCRAFLRFVGPWSDEGEAFIWSYAVIFLAALAYYALTGDSEGVEAVGIMTAYIWGANLVWRTLFGVLPTVFSKRLRNLLTDEWWISGQRPLLDDHLAFRRDWRRSCNYLRQRGMSRKEARQFAITCARSRRTTQYFERERLPWRAAR